jgi:tripartite-type tricarboxylate transporter receptor subunit TctC
MFNSVSTAVEVVKSGKARALAITSADRSPALPDVPTFPQAGVPGFEAVIWQGILAPKGTPNEIVQQLNKEIRATLADPEVIKQLQNAGVDPAGSSPDAFKKLIDSEIARWSKVIKDANIKIE